MKIIWTYPMGSEGWTRETTDAVVPSKGDEVTFPIVAADTPLLTPRPPSRGGAEEETLHVRYINHFPWGDPRSLEPFVYVVLSNRA